MIKTVTYSDSWQNDDCIVLKGDEGSFLTMAFPFHDMSPIILPSASAYVFRNALDDILGVQKAILPPNTTILHTWESAKLPYSDVIRIRDYYQKYFLEDKEFDQGVRQALEYVARVFGFSLKEVEL